MVVTKHNLIPSSSHSFLCFSGQRLGCFPHRACGQTVLEPFGKGSFAELCENPKTGGFCFLLSGFSPQDQVLKAVIMPASAAVFLRPGYHLSLTFILSRPSYLLQQKGAS